MPTSSRVQIGEGLGGLVVGGMAELPFVVVSNLQHLGIFGDDDLLRLDRQTRSRRHGERDMTKYQFHDDAGAPIDSHFEMQSRELILHSRGGTIGSISARNTQYGEALLLLLERIERSELEIAGIWVDSRPARTLPVERRAIYFSNDVDRDPHELSKRLAARMAAVGRPPHARRGRGNSTKRLRFAFVADVSDERIAWIAARGKFDGPEKDDRRLSAAMLNQVNADHIWRAEERLATEEVDHPFGESRGYDVILDSGQRLPPKAIFGLAASDALGFEVHPQHFLGGVDTPCFRTFRTQDTA